jgi:hypothetical protein
MIELLEDYVVSAFAAFALQIGLICSTKITIFLDHRGALQQGQKAYFTVVATESTGTFRTSTIAAKVAFTSAGSLGRALI